MPNLTADSHAAPISAPYDMLIVGGGAAGITIAAMLRGKISGSIAIIEPAETHAYQPGWTLVGAGVFSLRV